ncbi:MAG: histidine kinase, partial [Hyphomicrobiales bacterium]|nr:histidine kinase [Hyphomicrobiales bacterium]
QISIGTMTYSVAAAGNVDELESEISAFRTRTLATLAVFGFGLVLTMMFQVRYGLRPLDRIRNALSLIREGRREKIDGDVPSEIEPLVNELNALLASSQEIIERARTHVGN